MSTGQAVGILSTLITPSAVAGTPENTLYGIYLGSRKAAFVCRQAGCVADLFTAEYTGTVAFTGTERARSCHRNRERQHAGVCLQACVHYNRLAHCSMTFPVARTSEGNEK
ncbi:hypothetical protein PO909_007785 [Leuciscus waleckii]